MKKILVTGLLLSILDIGSALAQTRATPPGPPQVRYQQTTRYDFDNDTVEGTYARPDGETVDGMRKLRQSSLVRPRTNFTPEMVKSVESL
jgi:hypothetical protein